MNYHLYFQVNVGVPTLPTRLRPEVMGRDFLELDIMTSYLTGLAAVDCVPSHLKNCHSDEIHTFFCVCR